MGNISSLLSRSQCDLVNIPYWGETSEQEQEQEQEPTVAEDIVMEESEEEELLQKIRLEVAKQLAGVPWQTFNEAQKALRDRESAVENVIKMMVPLSHPKFTQEAMSCLLDKNVYFRLSPPTSSQSDPDPSFRYRLGSKIQWLPPQLSVLMQRFVFGEHGELTGYKANMSSLMDQGLQLKQPTPSEAEMKERFRQRQFDDLVHWIITQSEAIDEKTLVSVMT